MIEMCGVMFSINESPCSFHFLAYYLLNCQESPWVQPHFNRHRHETSYFPATQVNSAWPSLCG